jgi:hypothetical protein
VKESFNFQLFGLDIRSSIMRKPGFLNFKFKKPDNAKGHNEESLSKLMQLESDVLKARERNSGNLDNLGSHEARIHELHVQKILSEIRSARADLEKRNDIGVSTCDGVHCIHFLAS